MVLIPVTLLTLFQPGVLFPAMQQRESQRFRGKKARKSEAGVGSSGDETPELAEKGEPKTTGAPSV
jgi:hypothetical protein